MHAVVENLIKIQTHQKEISVIEAQLIYWKRIWIEIASEREMKELNMHKSTKYTFSMCFPR